MRPARANARARRSRSPIRSAPSSTSSVPAPARSTPALCGNARPGTAACPIGRAFARPTGSAPGGAGRRAAPHLEVLLDSAGQGTEGPVAQ